MICNLFFHDLGLRFTGVIDNAVSGLIVSAVWAGLLYLYFIAKTRRHKAQIVETIVTEAHMYKHNENFGLSLRNKTPYPFTVTNIYFDAGPHVGNLLPWEVAFCPDGTVLSAEQTDVLMRPYGFGHWRVMLPALPSTIKYYDVAYEFVLIPTFGVVRGSVRINEDLYGRLQNILTALNHR